MSTTIDFWLGLFFSFICIGSLNLAYYGENEFGAVLFMSGITGFLITKLLSLD